jgi:hypothetical protein
MPCLIIRAAARLKGPGHLRERPGFVLLAVLVIRSAVTASRVECAVGPRGPRYGGRRENSRANPRPCREVCEPDSDRDRLGKGSAEMFDPACGPHPVGGLHLPYGVEAFAKRRDKLR